MATLTRNDGLARNRKALHMNLLYVVLFSL